MCVHDKKALFYFSQTLAFFYFLLSTPCLLCLPACLPTYLPACLPACTTVSHQHCGCLCMLLALTACGWCLCRCSSEQCCGCVGLARSGRQHVSPAQQRCHGSDLKHCPPPLFVRLPCKLGTAVTVSPSNPCVRRGRHASF